MSFEKICSMIHSRLEITTSDGNFEGMLKFVLSAEKCLIFEHVFKLPSREYLGTMHINFSNVSSWTLVELSETIFDIPNFDLSKDFMKREFDKNRRIDKGDHFNFSTERHFIEFLPSNLKSNCPNDYCVVDSISPVFFRVIEHLSESHGIGVSFHGPKIARSGTLTWVSISTSSSVFLFDIQSLGKAAFEEGLKSIFENENIEKVIHDCREVADCVLHIFNTELVNVFDTQLADYHINMQLYTGKKIFKYVNSLDSCLFKYLEVPVQFLFNHNKSIKFDEEKMFYQKRPASDDFITVLIKSSMYLLNLKGIQEKLLMSPFDEAVELYLNSVQTAQSFEVHMMLTDSSHLVPSCLLESVKPIRFFDIPQAHDEFIKKFKDTLHGQKAWHNWKERNVSKKTFRL